MQTDLVYHGTKKDFTSFTLPTRYSPMEQLGFGIHFASDQQFAAKYAGNNGYIVCAKLVITKLLDADSIVIEHTPEYELAHKIAGKKLVTMHNEHGQRVAYLQNAIDSAHPSKASALIQDAGYDGVKYKAQYGRRVITQSGSHLQRGMIIDAESPAYVVFNPNQITVYTRVLAEALC